MDKDWFDKAQDELAKQDHEEAVLDRTIELQLKRNLAAEVSALIGDQFDHTDVYIVEGMPRLHLKHQDPRRSHIFTYSDPHDLTLSIAYCCRDCDADLTAPVNQLADIARYVRDGFPKHKGCKAGKTKNPVVV